MNNLGRIMIADDEEAFLYSTADLLRREGYQCDCAFDAKTATNMMHSGSYDLLIADIRMPGNPELEFIREIASIIEGMPIILVTGYPSINTAIQSIGLPVVSYLIKPIDFDDLLGQVNTVIGRFRIYKSICDTRKRLQDWNWDLYKTKKVMRETSCSNSLVPVDNFITLTLNNIFNTLTDLEIVTQGLTNMSSKQGACHLMNCPRLDILSNVLLEAIDILKESKKTFKIKELEKLRLKLEKILRGLSQ